MFVNRAAINFALLEGSKIPDNRSLIEISPDFTLLKAIGERFLRKDWCTTYGNRFNSCNADSVDFFYQMEGDERVARLSSF